jgi:antirestriction protein ArdC
MDDTIGLPNDSAFTCEHERESTKAHEGVHATGAKHRLDRKRGSRFGDASYAYEELVAELGAAMTCQYVGIPLEKLQHTQYLQTWLTKLKDDMSFLFSAAAEASKGLVKLSTFVRSLRFVVVSLGLVMLSY